MRPQSLGRPDRLFNRAAWHLAVSKRERLALGRFATRCLRNAGGGAVAPTKLDIRVSIRCYCSDVRKPQPLALLVWSYHRDAACACGGPSLCRSAKFFWATCFFFLLRALRSRRPSDWALAGLSAGLSEYFYYGTRLLPFILAMFMVFLLAVHWKHARQYTGDFGMFIYSRLALRNPNLYLGRGASLLIWSPYIPISFADFHRAGKTIWPVLSENLLGISTHTSQDSYLPKARSWSWALRCFCGTGVIRPRFSYSPRGWVACSWAERSWRIRTACHP
jgi:hypothetical protein